MKKCFIKVLKVALVAIIPCYVNAQSPINEEYRKVPSPPSPNATALEKFCDLDPDNYCQKSLTFSLLDVNN